MTIEFNEQSADCPPGTSLKEFEAQCGLAAFIQRSANWIIGDLALAAELQYPSTHEQAWPVWVSPDLLDRCKAVCLAYPPDSRNIDATWSIHMKHTKDPQRVALVQAHVDAGHTSDEARKTPVTVAEVVPEPEPVVEQEPEDTNRWLLCVDISYYINRQFPKSGATTAVDVCGWLARLILHLVETKNLTDVVVCFDGPNNHRKKLTEGWEFPYKDKRTEKDTELVVQLNAIPDRLKELNIPCVKLDGFEADDVMASYAAQFPGKVTLMTADKDLRQCLSPKCNILRDVSWEENTDTGQHLRTFDWVSAKKHFEDGVTYGGVKAAGITPEQWPHYQAIAGDPVDEIKGCIGIGGKGALDLIHAHGTVQGVIQACKDGTANLTQKKIDAVLDFEPLAETTLLLTTMRTDLNVPKITTLAMKGIS